MGRAEQLLSLSAQIGENLMRNTNYTQSLMPVRKVSARLTLTDTLMRFSALQASEDITIFSDDSEMVGTELLRIAIQADTDKLFFACHAADDDNFRNTTWIDTLRITFPKSRPGLFQNRVFYQGTDGFIYYADKTTAFGTPVKTTIYYTSAVSIAPVSLTEFYAVVFNEQIDHAFMMREVHFDTISGTDVMWEGRIYGDVSNLNLIDAVRVGVSDYIYVTDASEYRTVYLKRTGGWWSDLKPVIPMDVVDDMSLFRLASANVINGKVFITGVLKRTYGLAMNVYLVGPENFTFGRELFIRSENTDGVGGKLHLFDGYTFYVGTSVRFMAYQTKAVGINNPALTTDVELFGFEMNCQSNSPFSVNVEVPWSFSHAALRSGSEAVLETIVNDEVSKLGTFVLGSITTPERSVGISRSLSLLSQSVRRLSQWESDASYDYWSQTKLSCNPSEMDKVLRASGLWVPVDDFLHLHDFNKPCILYVSSKSSSNSLMKASFIRVSGDYKSRFGVGINYYRESAYDASVRTGMDMEDIDETEYGDNGIFAIYGDQEYFGDSGIGVYSLVDSVWTQIYQIPLVIPDDTEYWLMIKFKDGLIQVFTREASMPTWTRRINMTFESVDVMPWKQDNNGKGALMMENVTPYSSGYSFTSDLQVIPVHDNSLFRNSDEVIVDSERITYTSKSPNVTVPGLKHVAGRVTAQYTVIGPKQINIGKYRDVAYVCQWLALPKNAYTNSISLYLKKVGYPGDGICIRIYRQSLGGPTPLGGIVTTSSVIATGDVSHLPRWYSFNLHQAELKSGDIICVAREGGAGNDPYNHYATYVGASQVYGMPIHYFDENSDVFRDQFSGGDQILPSLPFILSENVEEPGATCMIHVKTDPALSVTNGYYTGMALVVTAGTGLGESYQIVGYKYGAETCLVYLERGNNFDDTSVFSIVPTLSGVTRATGDTLAAAHSSPTVHVYRDRPFVVTDVAEYYTYEQDMTLEDMATNIARKAGVLNVIGNNLYPSSIIPSAANPFIDRKNFTVKFNLAIPHTDGTIIVSGRRKEEELDGIDVRMSETAIEYANGATVREAFPLQQPLYGEVVVTYFDNSISIWCNGAFVYSFTITAPDYALNGKLLTITGSRTSEVSVYIPAAMIRKDNYILDAGKKGDALLVDLIGEKRFFFQDDIDGNMRLFQSRTEVNTIDTPYTMSIAGNATETDSSLVTRMRLEGSDIHEDCDIDMMVEYGNLFHMSNMNEINSPADAEYFSGVLLDDIGSRVMNKSVTGRADPRIEPNDLIYVSLPSGATKMIVDNVSFSMQQSESDAMYDMSISGRVPRESLL